MPRRYISLAERWGVPAPIRGAAVVLLAALLLGNLGFITYFMWPTLDPRQTAWLALMWLLGLVGLLGLFRLWRATTHTSGSARGV